MEVTVEVDRADRSLVIEARTTLLDALRADGATSVHAGCEQGACGACTVLLDGVAVRSCLVLAAQADGQAVTTVASLAGPGGALHPLQEAFRRHHALQCGFCTPAMLLSGVDLLASNPTPTEAEVRAALAGNLCRCTGYGGIVAAVLAVAESAVAVVATTGAPIGPVEVVP